MLADWRKFIFKKCYGSKELITDKYRMRWYDIIAHCMNSMRFLSEAILTRVVLPHVNGFLVFGKLEHINRPKDVSTLGKHQSKLNPEVRGIDHFW